MRQDRFAAILRRHPRQIETWRLGAHFWIDAILWATILSLRHFADIHPVLKLGQALLWSIFTFRAFGLMHDCVHGAVSRNAFVNRWCGELYGIFSFLPFSSWRKLHLDHHKWTGNVDRDPSMKLLLAAEKRGFHLSPAVHFVWRYWIPLLGFAQHLVFWTATLTAREYLFGLGGLIYIGLSGFILGPAVLALGFLFYMYMVEMINLPHHAGLKQFRGDAHFNLRDQGQFVRSCVYNRWLSRFVLLNFNLHTEHHLFPSHPWYQLDALHAELTVSPEEEFIFCVGNDWIFKTRRTKELDELFLDTFADAKRKNIA